jgi:hypothetical protein
MRKFLPAHAQMVEITLYRFKLLMTTRKAKNSSAGGLHPKNTVARHQVTNASEVVANSPDFEISLCSGMDLGSVLAITMAVATAVVAIFLGISYWKRR